MARKNKGPIFKFFQPVHSPTEKGIHGYIECNRPFKFTVWVNVPLEETTDTYKHTGGFTLYYNLHSKADQQKKIIERMAEWFYFTVIKENEHRPVK